VVVLVTQVLITELFMVVKRREVQVKNEPQEKQRKSEPQKREVQVKESKLDLSIFFSK
jgi:hypothetical protein